MLQRCLQGLLAVLLLLPVGIVDAPRASMSATSVGPSDNAEVVALAWDVLEKLDGIEGDEGVGDRLKTLYEPPTNDAEMFARLNTACSPYYHADWQNYPDDLYQLIICRTRQAARISFYHAVKHYRGSDSKCARIKEHGRHLIAAQLYIDEAFDGILWLIHSCDGEPWCPSPSPRDRRASVWQDTLWLDMALLTARFMQSKGYLLPYTAAKATSVADGVLKRWQAHWAATGKLPNHGEVLETQTATIWSCGYDVGSKISYSFTWNADGGNTPAEELAWMGAGAWAAAQWLGQPVPQMAKDALRYALSYNEPYNLQTMRTVECNSEQDPNQNRYWIENHEHNRPAIPYQASVFINIMTDHLLTGDVRPVYTDKVWVIDQIVKWTQGKLVPSEGGAYKPFFYVGSNRGSYIFWDWDHWVGFCGQPGKNYAYYSTTCIIDEAGTVGGINFLLTSPAFMLILQKFPDGTWAKVRLDQWFTAAKSVLREYKTNPPDEKWADCGFKSRNHLYARLLFTFAYLNIMFDTGELPWYRF